jgi:carbon storage regulator
MENLLFGDRVHRNRRLGSQPARDRTTRETAGRDRQQGERGKSRVTPEALSEGPLSRSRRKAVQEHPLPSPLCVSPVVRPEGSEPRPSVLPRAGVVLTKWPERHVTTEVAGMLVLTRKHDEEIVIGDIVIKVIECHQGRVKLGVSAPREMRVYRGEIHDAIRREQEVRTGRLGP